MVNSVIFLEKRRTLVSACNIAGLNYRSCLEYMHRKDATAQEAFDWQIRRRAERATKDAEKFDNPAKLPVKPYERWKP